MDAHLNEIVSVYPSLHTLSEAAALAFAKIVETAVAAKGSCTIALSGGRTPKALYEVLAKEYRDKVQWSSVHLFWGDERFVPQFDAASNYRMACGTLLNHIPIPSQNIHPVPTDSDSAENAAQLFDKQLHTLFSNQLPSFDLILLGIGLDGHTASIFPSTKANSDENVWAIHTLSPLEPKDRISLTLRAINNAQNIFFLISGAEKRTIVTRLFDEKKEELTPMIPAARVTGKGEVHYFIDEAAWTGRQ